MHYAHCSVSSVGESKTEHIHTKLTYITISDLTNQQHEWQLRHKYVYLHLHEACESLASICFLVARVYCKISLLCAKQIKMSSKFATENENVLQLQWRSGKQKRQYL